MTIRSDLLASLTGDTTLMATLTGGVYSGTEISRQNTPSAFDANLELKPCALLVVETDTNVRPYAKGARTYVTVMFYQRVGVDVIESAQARVYALWHGQRIGAQTWQVLWTDDVNDQEDQALNARLAVSRYAVTRMR